MTTPAFSLREADIALPTGAYAGGRRHVLRRGAQPIAAFTDGPWRPYLHPVWTPAGLVVTSEGPADHPHHSGIWCAADHVGLLMPAPDGVERYDYNFYVNDVFQGRAPGRIVPRTIALEPIEAISARVVQTLEWRGPREWAAPDGRLALTETRTTTVHVHATAHVFDIVSVLTPADVAIAIGPTRHAFFNVRVCESISLSVAQPIDDRGRIGGSAISGDGARAVDFSGPLGQGTQAGLAVVPAHGSGDSWFVADWGVITTGAMRRAAARIEPGATLRLACRFIAHDGALDPAGLAARAGET